MSARLAVLGASGRLGRRVVACALRDPALTLVAALTRPGSSAMGADAGSLAGEAPCGVPLTAATAAALRDVDVLIDVSLPGGLAALAGAPCAVVSGVTGRDGDEAALLAAWAHRAPVVVAANFSTGVHVLADLVGRAARALPDHDIEIVEAHHRGKVDAPSGTALLLGEAAAAARGTTLADAVHGRHGRTGPRGAGIGFHALRAGDIVGEHQVWIAGPGERLQLGHVATSRDTFAVGALRAAAWAASAPPGSWTMRHVLGLDATDAR